MTDYSNCKVYERDGFFVRIQEEHAEGLRELTEDEKGDISYLVDEKYLDFFTKPHPEYEESKTGYSDFQNYPDIYPDIMNEFKVKVLNALQAANDYGLLNRHNPIWAQMRDKYFGVRPYVYPDEMIENLYEFDNKEIIAFLHYCTNYKERFFTGAYGLYAEEGYIGKLLLRLKELPLTIEFEAKGKHKKSEANPEANPRLW